MYLFYHMLVIYPYPVFAWHCQSEVLYMLLGTVPVKIRQCETCILIMDLCCIVPHYILLKKRNVIFLEISILLLWLNEMTEINLESENRSVLSCSRN